MQLSSKFFGLLVKKVAKIGEYLTKIWTKYNSLVFGPPCLLHLQNVCKTNGALEKRCQKWHSDDGCN